MPKATNMYQCSKCKRYMPSAERVRAKTEFLTPVYKKIVKDYCTGCVDKALKGEEARPVWHRA